MYKLYYSPGTCSMAVHILFIEIQEQFELVDTSISAGKNRTPEFLAVNPRGSVPVLDDNGAILREGAAILMHLAEKHKSPLLPASGDARREAIEWLCFFNSTLHPAYGRLFFLLRNEGTDKQFQVSYAAIQKQWNEIEGHLSKQAYIAGADITLADILMTVIANWGDKFFPGKITLGPVTKKLLKTVSSRPAFRQAMKAEGVEYLAAG